MENIENNLKVAIEGTARAEAALSKSGSDAGKIDLDTGRDIKIAGDRLAEKAVIDCLKEGSDFDVLSEESGYLALGKQKIDDPYWIVDPLDGSYNFSRGMPLFACSIALWHESGPVLGVIRDLSNGDVYSAAVGKGAWLNGEGMCVSDVNEREKAVIATGFPVKMDISHESLNQFFRFLIRFKKVRMLGAAAIMLAYVAAGKIDIYREENTRIWDVAAGLALVKAAGGKVEFTETKNKTTLSVTAWNGLFEPEMT
ncbi:inositol monophosphatase family protein [Candidatus Riflebacteria bacterium]